MTTGSTEKLNRPESAGFTIIELLIATTIFSLILLLAVAGILQVTKLYRQGVTQARVQEAARNVVEEISEAIRFSTDSVVHQSATIVTGPEVTPDNHANYFCLGRQRYTYAMDRQLKTSPASGTKEKRRVLWVDQPAVCDGASGPADLDNGADIDGRELLSENMRLTRFEITTIGVDVQKINISVAYGADDLFNIVNAGDVNKTCRTVFTGAEFCAVSNLSVVATKRL